MIPVLHFDATVALTFICNVGQGPLNYCLKLLVFGNEEQDTLTLAEEGEENVKLSDTTSSGGQKNGSEEAATAELSTTQYCLRLLFCIFGLQGAYLTWGVLQVGDVDCP